VFTSSAGTPVAVRNIIRRGLQPALEAASLPKLRWHDLRHIAASRLIADGVPIGDVSRQLANSNVTLAIYTHAFDSAAQDERIREGQERALAFAKFSQSSGDDQRQPDPIQEAVKVAQLRGNGSGGN
jgi:integrase-like protein